MFRRDFLSLAITLTHVTNKTRWYNPGDTDTQAKLSEYMVKTYGVSKKCVLIGKS